MRLYFGHSGFKPLEKRTHEDVQRGSETKAWRMRGLRDGQPRLWVIYIRRIKTQANVFLGKVSLEPEVHEHDVSGESCPHDRIKEPKPARSTVWIGSSYRASTKMQLQS